MIRSHSVSRLLSLDVYRGATMLFMASELLRTPRVAHQLSESAVWRFIGFHTSHVEWRGISAWDMIQPSFMFMVGVALPWSIASRQAKGQGLRDLWVHALWRAVLLAALGIFLRSVGRPQTNFTFEDVLTQIGLGYPILFALGWLGWRKQAAAAALILVGYWAAFALYPLPPQGFDFPSVGVPANWPHHPEGFAAHWDKNTNLAHAADVWFLNLFPRVKPFLFNGGGYLTLNFVPSLVTMIFGLLAGGLLRSSIGNGRKIRMLLLAGLVGVLLGGALDLAGICPAVKRIWTPSWTLLAGGWTLWILAGCYWVIDVKNWKWWAFPFLVVGMNSIAIYTMVHLWDGFIAEALKVHLGRNLFAPLGAVFEPMLQGAAVVTVLWLICLWMYRRGLFLRI